MPVTVRKTESGKYRVSTPGGVKAKGTTRKKAMAQKRLLQGVEHGWEPTGKKAKSIKNLSKWAMSKLAKGKGKAVRVKKKSINKSVGTRRRKSYKHKA